MEDCCFICAEPLEWVASGPCGHKESCSKCVMRMRFVLKDNRCVMCQQDAPAVFVTRAMGSFTASLAADKFSSLNFKTCRDEGLHCLKSCSAFFDDEDHYHTMRRLCSFTHSSLAQDNQRQQTFQSLKDLKKHLATTSQKHFCDVCLANRKVFVSEQQLYTRSELDRHNKQGDVTGPLAESGFTGHPQCKFCRKRFYGDNEIFQHMQTAHEHCFLCRRTNPDKYVYYKDYEELEAHFKNDHFLCEDSECLSNRFVVFQTAAELKQHVALEHKHGLTKGQRREALTLETGFQYDRGAYSGRGDGSRPAAIVIGGGAGMQLRSSGGRGQQAQSGLHDHERQMVAAMQASLLSAQAEASAQAMWNPEDFPSAGGSSSSAAVGASASGRWAAAASSSFAGGSLSAEEFPSLPGSSKSARRRANQRAKAASGQGSSSSASHMHHSSSAPSLTSAAAQAPRFADPPARVPDQPVASVAAPSQRPPQASPALPHAPPAAAEDWPQMAPSSAAPLPAAHNPQWAAAAAAQPQGEPASWVPSSQGVSLPEPAVAAPAPDCLDAFPSLPASSPRRGKGGRRPQSAAPGRTAPASSSAAPSGARGELAASSSASASGSQVSESLREANRLLIDKIRQRVDEPTFAAFKLQSGKFMRSEIGAQQYFGKILDLGLLSLTPELAALCPEPQRRTELLEAFRAHSASPAAHGFSWTPPEVVDAVMQQAGQFGTWQCPQCSIMNGPQAVVCEGCTAERSVSRLPAASDVADNGDDNEYAVTSNSKKGKKGKKSKFNRLRIGEDGGGSSGASSNPRTATHPQNAWTQPGGAPVRGAWAGAGGAQLAQSVSAVNTAWGGRR